MCIRVMYVWYVGVCLVCVVYIYLYIVYVCGIYVFLRYMCVCIEGGENYLMFGSYGGGSVEGNRYLCVFISRALRRHR